MISLKCILHCNNYPECITSAPRNLDRRIEEYARKCTMICLPYVKGLAQRICCLYDIRTIFTNRSTLWRYLFRVKPPTEFNMIKNCVYSIHYSRGKAYKGEIWRYLFRVKPPTEFNMIKNCVYSIHYSRGKAYKGEICRSLKIML